MKATANNSWINITYFKMRVKITNDKNVVQCAHGKISLWLSAGTYTLYQSVNGTDWESFATDAAGEEVINISGVTPTSFIKVEENSDAEFLGEAIGVNSIY